MKVVIERKGEELAGFVLVPASAVAGWRLPGTTIVEATLDGVPLGRRSLKRLADGGWFLELRRDLFAAVGKEAGERATLEMTRAKTEVPEELRRLLDGDAGARGRWEARTASQRRMALEHILEAKSPAARERRARGELFPDPPPAAPPVAGLTPSAKAIVVRIVGRRLPGLTFGPYGDVRVALAAKVGCDPEDGVRGDAREATWETELTIRDQDGRPAFRGPAVNGPPRERFLYLTWLGRKGRGPLAKFRRAKLRLDAIPAAVLAGALRSGHLVARLDLTGEDGTPVCASVRPPAIEWSS